jgi:arginine N-succinyltransferase
MRMLESEGFSYNGYIDIFDGGPTMEASINSVRSIVESRSLVVRSTSLDQGERSLVAAGNLDLFRCSYAVAASPEEGVVDLDAATVEALGVQPGDTVLHVAR